MPFFATYKAKMLADGEAAGQPPRLAASIEVAPAQVIKRPELLELIPPATRVALVDLGNLDVGAWAALTGRMARLGLEPVPHIAARRLASVDALDERLRAMTTEAGVRDVLVVAGEADRPAGPFGSSIDVLESGLLDKHGIRRIAVAGHPDGSPVIGEATIEAALRMKTAYRERTGANMRILPQFGFDATRAIRWAESLADAGFDLPIHLGVAGPASVKSLFKYAQICGVRASSQFLARRGSAVTSLMTTHSPEPQVAPVEAHVAKTPGTLIQQFHVFPFGGIQQAAEWLVERGSWAADTRRVFAPALTQGKPTKTSSAL
jgi:methylenetetrahydrofolate reductase (NADPH)